MAVLEKVLKNRSGKKQVSRNVKCSSTGTQLQDTEMLMVTQKRSKSFVAVFL